MRPSSRQKLRDLWEEHLAAGFPAELYENPGGVEMVSVDSAIAGCVSTVVETGKLSDPRHAAAVDACLAELRTVAPLLKYEEAAQYCQRLVALAQTLQEQLAHA